MSKYSDDSATYAKENIEKAAAVSEDVLRKFKRLSGNRLNFRTARETGSPAPDESGRIGNANETKSPDGLFCFGFYFLCFRKIFSSLWIVFHFTSYSMSFI